MFFQHIRHAIINAIGSVVQLKSNQHSGAAVAIGMPYQGISETEFGELMSLVKKLTQAQFPETISMQLETSDSGLSPIIPLHEHCWHTSHGLGVCCGCPSRWTVRLGIITEESLRRA